MTESKRKGIYLLPNLLTTAGIFSGFYAVVASMKGEFEAAAIAIFVAMIFDGLDGRVARMTQTQSEFGAEYDSMSDMVSFGIAPALVAYNWALSGLNKLGWLAAFVYVAGAALRLARFNTQASSTDKRFFQGLPSPSAAALVAALIWVGEEYQVKEVFNIYFVQGMVAVLTALSGMLMVSNFKYNSFKEVNWQGKVPFVAILLVTLIFIIVATEPSLVLFIVFALYTFAGPINTFRSVETMTLEHVVGDTDDQDADFKDNNDTATEDGSVASKNTKN